jgi:hypothetical protein
MGDYRVEPADGGLAGCACCAGEAGLRGFVFEDGVPRAVYFVEPLGMPNYPLAKLGMAIGDWSPGAAASARLSLGFLIRPGSPNAELSASDAKLSGFPELPMLGRPVAGDELGAHERRAEFEALARVIVAQDWRLEPLRGGLGSGSRFSAEPV